MICPAGQPDNQYRPAHAATLARRHLRGYPLKSYQPAPAGQRLVLSGPTDPQQLLAEPRVEERFDTDDYMPYWSDLWPSSAGLADYMLASHLHPIGKHHAAVELGCGLGLTGIAAGLLGWRVVFTDYDVDALIYSTHNAVANGLRDFDARLLDWRHPPADLHADLLIGADVLYEKRNHPALLSCTHALLTYGGIAVFADPQRDGATGFATAAQAAGFELSIGMWPNRHPGNKSARIDLYFLRKPAGSP